MRLLLCSLPLLTLASAAVAVPPLPPPDRAVRAQAAPIINPQAFTRQLFSRFHERIVDVEERHSGLGAFLVGYTLYEQPEALHTAGLCQVRVHEVSVNTAPPPENPPRHADAVRTSTRFFAIGPVHSSVPPAAQGRRCASIASARHFFTATQDDARIALQALTDARYFVANQPRAISFTCTSYRGPCLDPSQLFMRYLTPDRVRSVERAACANGSSDIYKLCFRISFHHLPDGIGGDWTVTTQGLRRPVHFHLEQSHPPVV